jgi:pimeloyl-ACP methyl ester carboxylesterase
MRRASPSTNSGYPWIDWPCQSTSSGKSARFDCDAPLRTAVADRLVPVPFGWLSEPISLPRFWSAALPTSYVLLRQDQAVPQELDHAMARRLDHPRLVECDGPHEAMLTHPDLLAAALIDAAVEQL